MGETRTATGASRRDLVVGFDLDMTLIDTVVGFVATLDALAAEWDVVLPSAQMSAKLGPPLDQMLAPYLPAGEIEAAADRFRALYPEHAVTSTPALPGVTEALAAVRAEHGRIVLVTGKYEPNARLHVEHLGLDVDHVEGWVWGEAKGAVLRDHGAHLYVGDHVHDVEGARAAAVTSVSVLTGGCTAEELRAAGTDVILEDLTAFPDWLAEHLLSTRLAWLEDDLRGLGRVLVAFSGGADSAFLLAAAHRALGPERVTAAIAVSPSLAGGELDAAQEFARGLGVEVLTPATDELSRAGYVANAGDRCAFCKGELLDVLAPLAAARGAVVVTGTNADDVRAGFRPGIAAAAERGASTPLRDARFTKAQVREASRRWGLTTWDKPAAACLSSRVAYGVEVSAERLARIDRAEAAVRSLLTARAVGQGDLRVRDLGDRASIELDPDRVRRLDAGLSADIVTAVLAAGFGAAEVDPRGFRSGSMNELLPDPERYR